MKILYIIVFYLISFSSYSQNLVKGIEVEYKAFFDTEIPFVFTTVLFAKNNTAIYQEKTRTSEKWQDKALSDQLKGQTINYSALKSDFEPYFLTDPAKKAILFYAKILKSTVLVKDEYELKWKITRETKKIAGYDCVKAQSLFRGRIWTAWFTPDIPIPFGPWKLHGLPGLILEAYDAANRYAYKVERISVLKNPDIFRKDFASLMTTVNTEPLSYRDYISQEEEAQENNLKQISQKINAKVTKRKTDPQSREEVEFEWE